MYKHILIPTDGSELSDRAMRAGIELAAKTRARVTLLTASPPLRALVAEPDAAVRAEDYRGATARIAEERLNPWSAYAKERGVKVDLRHVYVREPAEAIVETVRRKGCDLVVMASHGRRGIAGVLLGSETHKVLAASKVPVLVCR